MRFKKNNINKLKESGNLPRHIAIIMDGNGRWAKKRGLPRVAGHHEGVNSVREIVETCGELEIQVLTLYTFSTENWRRPKAEVSALMKLLIQTLRKKIDELVEKNVKLIVSGNLDRMPQDVSEGIREGIQKTKGNTGLILNMALNYGGREEIVHAVRLIADKVKQGSLDPKDIEQGTIQGYLYTADLPDPDLLIRTSREFRISNFLLWQLAYTEIYITDVLWPDFRGKELFKAINEYQKRERRFGKVSDQLTS